MKNKKSVSRIISTKNLARRKRFDVLIIMVAVVGIAGSIIVFNSYASRKLATEVPGEYSIINLQAQSGSDFVNTAKVKSSSGQDIIHMNNNSSINTPFNLPSNQFCIYGWNRAGATMNTSSSDGSIGTPVINNLSSDYPLSVGPSRQLQCYKTNGKAGDRTNLVITSGNNIWIDKIVTE
jgi:hypothetical protein